MSDDVLWALRFIAASQFILIVGTTMFYVRFVRFRRDVNNYANATFKVLSEQIVFNTLISEAVKPEKREAK